MAMNVKELQALLTKLFPTCSHSIFRDHDVFYVTIFFDVKSGRQINIPLKRKGVLWEFGRIIDGPRSLSTWESINSQSYSSSELGNAILDYCHSELSSKIDAANKAVKKLKADLLVVTKGKELLKDG